MWGGCFLPEESAQDFHNISTARMKKKLYATARICHMCWDIVHLLKRAVCKPPWGPWDNNIMHIILKTFTSDCHFPLPGAIWCQSTLVPEASSMMALLFWCVEAPNSGYVAACFFPQKWLLCFCKPLPVGYAAPQI